jgi:hypothetical protein
MRGKPRPISYACILCLIAWDNTPSQSSPAQACSNEYLGCGNIIACRKYVVIRDGESSQRSSVASTQALEATALRCRTFPSETRMLEAMRGHAVHIDFCARGAGICNIRGCCARGSEMNDNHDPHKGDDAISTTLDMYSLKRAQTHGHHLALRGGGVGGQAEDTKSPSTTSSYTSHAKDGFNISVHDV